MARLKSKKEEIIGNLDPKYWVQKSDPLVLMRSVPFSLGELKILDTYISRINAGDNSRRTVIFTKEEYEELMGLNEANIKSLQKHTESLLGKVVTLEMPNKQYLQFTLFEQAKYCKDKYDKPIIELSCSSLAQDLFFCIGKYHYFKYALENVVNLTRKGSYLLYLHILTNRYRVEWETELDELRDKVLDCKKKESYQEFKEFKRAVLEPAVKEVNEKTDCHFEYEPVKRGRKVVKIKFIYHPRAIDELDGQLTLEELSQSENSLNSDPTVTVDYGTELYTLLGNSALDNSFTPEEVCVISDLIVELLPYPANDLERCDYLTRVYHTMKRYDSKKPINNKFLYLQKILKSEIEKKR